MGAEPATVAVAAVRFGRAVEALALIPADSMAGLEAAEEVLAARLELYTALRAEGWTVPARLADTVHADAALLAQPSHEGHGRRGKASAESHDPVG